MCTEAGYSGILMSKSSEIIKMYPLSRDKCREIERDMEMIRRQAKRMKRSMEKGLLDGKEKLLQDKSG